MKYDDLRGFVARLEALGELKRIGAEVDPRHEMTEICDRVLKAQGPAVLFEKAKVEALWRQEQERVKKLQAQIGSPIVDDLR